MTKPGDEACSFVHDCSSKCVTSVQKKKQEKQEEKKKRICS